MSFLELAKKRESSRGYLGKAVERDVLKRCVEAARLAPSACNSQPWHFVVADEPELVARIASATKMKVTGLNSFCDQVPAFAVIVAEKANLSAQIGAWLKRKDFRLLDIGMAAEHFCLQAADEGLGTCMLGWFDEREIQKNLSISRSKRIALVIAIGHPADNTTREKVRKSLDAMHSFNKYEVEH